MTNDVDDFSFERRNVRCNECGGLGLIRVVGPSIKEEVPTSDSTSNEDD
jgi:excinuclease UvrABC ATPase subunit